MVSVSLAHAKTHLSALLDRVENGEPFTITRHGRPVATVSPAVEAKRPLRSLAALRAGRPGWRGASADRLREARDEGL
jgi:prevent-host-death family protein